MNLINEIGISELIEKISVETVDSAFDYIKNNDINLLQFIGFLSLFAHTTEKSYYDYVRDINKILKIKLLNKNIYNEIEKLDIIYSAMEDIDINQIQKLFDDNLSGDVLQIVANHEPINLKPNFNLFGINYLFSLLINNDRINFEYWIKATKRIDFKIVFLNLLFSYNYNKNINIKNIEESNIPLLQAFWALSNFDLINYCRNIYLPEAQDISYLFNSKISDRNKFVLYLQYITNKYHGKKLQELDENIELNRELEKFTEINYDYTKEDLLNNTGTYYSILCFKIIQRSKNQEKRELLLQELQKIIINYLKRQEFVQHNIDYANLLGLIAIESKDCQYIEKSFEKEYKELSFPYSFCKVKGWSQRVVFMFYLLVGINMYKKYNKQNSNDYIEKFNFIKSGIKKYTFKDFDQYINQI